MANILDDICEGGPVLSAEMARPKSVSKATVQRCISKLSPHWDEFLSSGNAIATTMTPKRASYE